MLIVESGFRWGNSTEKATIPINNITLESFQTKKENFSILANYRAIRSNSDVLFAAIHFRKNESIFFLVASSILMSGGQGRLKPSPGSFFVASMPSLLPEVFIRRRVRRVRL
jgi:hypothetical protein